MTPAAQVKQPERRGPWDEREVQVCGGRIPYRRLGEGQPVLILHRDNGMLGVRGIGEDSVVVLR